jgi:hypothetical protein
MALILFVIMPIGWAVSGWLLGRAVSATVPTDAARRFGKATGRCCAWFLPALHVLLLVLGGSGDAGHGVRLFGSEELFGLLCLPFYTVPAFLLYLGAACVIRDLIRGLSSLRAGPVAPSSIPLENKRC